MVRVRIIRGEPFEEVLYAIFKICRPSTTRAQIVSQGLNIAFLNPNSTPRGLNLTLRGLKSTPKGLIRSTTRAQVRLPKAPKSTFRCSKLTLRGPKSAPRGLKIDSKLLTNDSERPKSDYQRPKTDSRGSKIYS